MAPVRYFTTIVGVLFGGTLWWCSLLLSWVLGVGFFSEYPAIRQRVSDWMQVAPMPEAFPLWLLVALLLIWIIGRLAHREALREISAARISFELLPPYRNVGLHGSVETETGAKRVPLGALDIASIIVRNIPYDGADGKAVVDAFGQLEVFDLATGRLVLSFDYPRWEGNPKPGYHDHPRDHYPDEWKRRTLSPSGDANRMDFLIKGIDQDCAYGFRGRSQILPMWSDERLKLPAGDYRARITIAGVGLRQPAEQWLTLNIGGRGQSFVVEAAAPLRANSFARRRAYRMQ
jgi:hypothetical protein